MTARPKEMCPKCREYYSLKGEIKSIGYYKMCSKCIVEMDTGKPYVKPVSPSTLCKTCNELTKSKMNHCIKCGSLKLYKSDFIDL